MSTCLRGVGLGSRVNVPLFFILGECVHYREGGPYRLFKGEKAGRGDGGERSTHARRDGGGSARVARGHSANEQIS